MRPELDRNQRSRSRGDLKPTADEIADMADSGISVSEYFTNQGTMEDVLYRFDERHWINIVRQMAKAGKPSRVWT